MLRKGLSDGIALYVRYVVGTARIVPLDGRNARSGDAFLGACRAVRFAKRRVALFRKGIFILANRASVFESDDADDLEFVVQSGFHVGLGQWLPVALLDKQRKGSTAACALWKDELDRLHIPVAHRQFSLFRLRVGIASVLQHDVEPAHRHRLLFTAITFCSLVVPPFQAWAAGDDMAPVDVDWKREEIRVII